MAYLLATNSYGIQAQSCSNFGNLLGDAQNLPGHGCAWPAVAVPGWAGGLDQMTSRGPFQPKPFVIH